MSRIVGIDLGTTNSCVAVMDGKRPRLIPNSLQHLLTPSVVRFLPTGEVTVGAPALSQRARDPDNTILSVKRLMGRRFNEIMDLIPSIPYPVGVGNSNIAVIECHGQRHTPQYVSALVLRSLLQDVQRDLGEDVHEVVLCVPAYFTTLQREATRQAATIAGWDVKRIIREPVAACLYYGLLQSTADIGTVGVCDLGGGTFDVSVLELGDGVAEVKSISGDTHLGGDDFDQRITEWIRAECVLRSGILPSSKPDTDERIRAASTEAKHCLSGTTQADIHLPSLELSNGQRVDLNLELTIAVFEELCAELFNRLRQPCRKALRDAGDVKVDLVLLIGGASRMTRVREIAQEVFKPKSIRSFDQDVAVAMGAAVQAGVMSGAVRDYLLLDVTWASLGIETADGKNTWMVPRNTTIPTKKTETFATAEDGQTSVEIRILEGEFSEATDNRSISTLRLEGLPSRPRGKTQIEVTFDLDANQSLRVHAKETVTGQTATIMASTQTGLSDESMKLLSSTLRVGNTKVARTKE